MSYNLKEKNIIVIGGCGLIGRAIVDRLKNEGAKVFNLDISIRDNEDAYEFHCDITDGEKTLELLDKIYRQSGKIDGLVNVAYPHTGDWSSKFEIIAFESWKKNIDYQLNSSFLIIQKVSQFMKRDGGGSIVCLASIYGIVAPDFTIYEGTPLTSPAAYSAIKGGLINFSRYVASYLGEFNVRVNCISPGGIFDSQNPKFVENYEKKVPLKRMGTPEDISGPVAFLLSEDSKYITGQNLAVDGGWTAI